MLLVDCSTGSTLFSDVAIHLSVLILSASLASSSPSVAYISAASKASSYTDIASVELVLGLLGYRLEHVDFVVFLLVRLALLEVRFRMLSDDDFCLITVWSSSSLLPRPDLLVVPYEEGL